MSYAIETRCIHPDAPEQNPYGALSCPIFQTASFEHPGPGLTTGFEYSRVSNPTRSRLEEAVASLEEGTRAFAFASGMAAISAAFGLLEKNSHLIIEDDLYGGSIRLLDLLQSTHGITYTSLPLEKTDPTPVFRENTRAIFLETPTNPMTNVIDIRKMAKIAHAHGAILIVDNTFLSPYLQNPLSLGADVVVHSGTKYLSGHNDTLSGFVVLKSEELAEKIAFLLKTTGAALSPMDSWLTLRGIQTLAIRMRAAEENAGRIAAWLEREPHVLRVFYPGLLTHPGHEIMKKQAAGFGAMISFEVESRERAKRVLEKIRLIRFAESLGGTESLLTYPITQTHAELPHAMLEKNGITDRLLRMSVGIEDVGDLMDDLRQALADDEQQIFHKKD